MNKLILTRKEKQEPTGKSLILTKKEKPILRVRPRKHFEGNPRGKALAKLSKS